MITRSRARRKELGHSKIHATLDEKEDKDKESYDGKVKAVIQIGIVEWILTFGLIFGGCCSNVFALEKLVRQEPQSGNLITFFQFLFVSVEGLYRNIEWNQNRFTLKERKVPIINWIIMVTLFWSVSVLNNLSLGFKISMPFHIIFRSASIIISMCMGWVFFQRR